MKQLFLKTREEWKIWLSKHHNIETEVWLVFYKKETGKPSIKYEVAVEEVLCFGWIDSLIKKFDDTKYVRKFTPRKENSKWSKSNKKRVSRMIKEGQMTKFGLIKINAAKKSGAWDKSAKPDISFDLPQEFKKALAQNKKANNYFCELAPSYQKQYIGWIAAAKQQETKKKRLKESIALLEKGRKLGLK